MKRKKDLSSKSMQMLKIITLSSESGKKDNPEQVKELVLRISQSIYKEAFKKGFKLTSQSLTPAIFVISTDKTTYMINDLESHYSDKEKMVCALRAVIKQFIINGEIPEFFYHFTEVRSYVTKGPNDPFQEYANKVGIPFPGFPMSTQFMISFETPTSYSLSLYDINESTGKFTEAKNLPITVTDETTVKHKDPNQYGGMFTHLVYKPEDAVKFEETMDVIEMKDTSFKPKK